MTSRKAPAALEIAAWGAYIGYLEFLATDDLDVIRDAVATLRDELLANDWIRCAPDHVLLEHFRRTIETEA